MLVFTVRLYPVVLCRAQVASTFVDETAAKSGGGGSDGGACDGGARGGN